MMGVVFCMMTLLLMDQKPVNDAGMHVEKSNHGIL